MSLPKLLGALGAVLLAATPLCAAAAPAPVPDTKQAAAQAAAAKVYDLSKLHHIDIEIGVVDVPKVESRSDARVSCVFSFDGVVLQNVGIRQAGGTVHPYRSITNKPSLSIKFDEFVDGQDLHGIKKIVLKNFHQDLSLMNEHMTYEVFRRAGLAAPLTAYALVTINGRSAGLYLIREPVNNQFLVRNFGKGNETGNLYEFALTGDIANNPGRIDLKDEAEDSRSRADIHALARVLNGTSGPAFAEAAGKLVDLDRYIRFMAVEAVTSDMDGFTFHNNNSFMYALPSDGRFVFFPHGADESFWATGTPITRLSGPHHPPQAMLGRKVQAVPELMAQYDREVAAVSSAPVWDQAALLERVAQVARILSTAERKGITSGELQRFEVYRSVVEGFIRSNGTTRTGVAR